MSNEPPPPPTESNDDSGNATNHVILVSYPKIVFLWPSYLVAIVAAIFMHVSNQSATAIDPAGGGAVVSWTFLILLSLNLVVLSFDFPRTTSLTLFFVIVALGLGGALAVVYFPDLFPAVREWIAAIHPQANATFYYIFAGVMTVIYAGVLVNRRFDYWEVRPNELLHHHGVLSDLERFSSPHLRIDKEINDIFEYLLLGSGRLILHPSNEKRAVVLENVLFISGKESKITKLLGALQVQVREES